MSEAKFTPGPWKIKRYDNYDGFSIASESKPTFGCIAERWEAGRHKDRERDANAQLITMAPNLYEIVNKVSRSSSCPNDLIEEAKEAIEIINGELV